MRPCCWQGHVKEKGQAMKIEITKVKNVLCPVCGKATTTRNGVFANHWTLRPFCGRTVLCTLSMKRDPGGSPRLALLAAGWHIDTEAGRWARYV